MNIDWMFSYQWSMINEQWIMIVDYWLLINDWCCWILYTVYCILNIEYWMLIIDYWLLLNVWWLWIIDYGLLIVDYLSLMWAGDLTGIICQPDDLVQMNIMEPILIMEPICLQSSFESNQFSACSTLITTLIR